VNNSRWHLFWLLLAAAVIFFTHLGATALWDEDEPWYASTAREMYQRGDWVTPMFNGQLFPEKPPLMFWTMIAGFEVFGVNELGARFFSAVFATAAVLMVYCLGRLLFAPRVGLWAGLITASTIIFTVSARAATVDAALTCATTGALLCFVMLLRRGEGTGIQGSAAQFAICNFLLWIALYACLGVAVLGKGPVGFLLPAASIGLFYMILNYRQHEKPSSFQNSNPISLALRATVRFFGPGIFFRSLWAMRPLLGAVVVLSVAMPWYVLVTQRTDGEWLRVFLAKFNFRPFTQPILGHSGPFWYHVPAVLIGFFPWSIFLGPAAVDVYRRIRNRLPSPCGRGFGGEGNGEEGAISTEYRLPIAPRLSPLPKGEGTAFTRDGLILLLCWFGVPFVFWSICSTKLPHYLLPVYPALALLTGVFIEDWIAEPAFISGRWLRAAWLSAVLAGVAMLVAIPIATHLYTPGEEWLAAVGLIFIFGGGLGWFYSERRQPLRAVAAYAVAATIFLTVFFGFAALRIDRHQNARRLIAEIRRDSPGPASLCTYRFWRKSTIYYAEQPVSVCDTPKQLDAAINPLGRTYILTLDKYVDEIGHRHPGEFRELVRQRRFLGKDQMVVLVRADPHPAARTAASPGAAKE
jgi:4-amino-4-deoxy-L-arabinose transferase-like glycosyltransferase